MVPIPSPCVQEPGPEGHAPTGQGGLWPRLGWPWFAAAALLAVLPFWAALSPEGAARALPGLAITAAVLALLATPCALLRGTRPPRHPEAAPAAPGTGAEREETQALLREMRQLLDAQRGQTLEAGATLGRAVAAGAQFSALAQATAARLRSLLEEPPAAPPAPAAASVAASAAALGLPERLEAVLRRLETALPAEALSRIEVCVEQLRHAGPALEGLPEAVDGLSAALRALDAHRGQAQRREAALGDAARYLTETTDRLTGGTAALETQAVRLQAMISILGQRERGTPG